MSNMSYCRFHNTLLDLNDCINALEDRDIASDEEKRKARQLIIDFLKFAENEQIIEGYSVRMIDDIIEECEDQY